jgi:hypothetical protein
MLVPQAKQSHRSDGRTGRAAGLVTRRLAAHGFGADSRAWGEVQEIVIFNVTGARSCLDITDSGYAQWHYEPRTGPATDPATLTAIILHIFGAPPPAASAGAYRAFTLKGAAGRQLQDHGLDVSLQVDTDLEAFEAATEIEVTSPAQPRRGFVRLNDEGELEWECDYGAAFNGDAARLIDTMVPVLRQGTGHHTRSALRSPRTFSLPGPIQSH